MNCEGGIETPDQWNDGKRPKLWLYQLHYFEDLCAVDASVRRQWHSGLISRWIRENPCGSGVGWEPYPLSLRVVNWIKWRLAGNELPPGAAESLVQQVRYLVPRLERHLLANHLLENLEALVFAGCFFDSGEADGWRRQGLQALEEQVGEQVLADGAHYELSPMYQGLILEGLLDVANLLGAYGHAVPSWLGDACERMLRWSWAMTHPDGEWAQFNDTALGYAATAGMLADYASRLGIGAQQPSSAVTFLRESGFVRVERRPWVLFADVGNLGPDYNPAHGHADSLCFELSLGKSRLLVDTGISTYEVGKRRAFERSTGAHNTVEIDGEDSSEVWAAFRVARRARASGVGVSESKGCVEIVARHDGYRRLRGAPLVSRTWQLDDRELRLTESVESRGSHRLQLTLHLAPGLQVKSESESTFRIEDATGAGLARLDSGSWTVARLADYEYAPGFGERQSARAIVLSHRTEREVTLWCALRLA